jgi:hypothetical protein
MLMLYLHTKSHRLHLLNDIRGLDTGLFVHKKIISAVNRVDLVVSDRMLYIRVRGHWCDIVLNVHVPTEDKVDDMKDSFCQELVPMQNFC